MKNKIVTIVFCVALIIFMLTFSIGLPIYCRFFYYLQIEPLGLTQSTNWSFDQIKTAYDDVLNFLTLPGFEFKTGELAFSESGKSHFEDCKWLFNLNLFALIASTATLILILALKKLKKVTLVKFFNRNCYFYSAIIPLIIMVVLAAIIAIDFNAAFEVFHAILFPGKDNWIFNPYTDEIILVMPQQFFMNCAILIATSFATFCVSFIVAEIISSKKQKNNA
ncbi:MAG: TIGR01906 family membrane protein [Clostridiales bacterium]|nr:TIGR01906 family membrane protein [Clostridiales bacterium]